MALDSPHSRLKWAREYRSPYKSPTEAARAFGWVISTYLGHENGDRIPSRPTAKKYAKAYRVRWEWLLEGQGPTFVSQKSKIIGIIGQNHEVVIEHGGNLRETDLPAGGTADTVALRVSGDVMRGLAENGWLFFFDKLEQPAAGDLIGKLCIVETNDGKVYARILQKGSKKGYFHLESPNGAFRTIPDQLLKWAAEVTWIKPRYE